MERGSKRKAATALAAFSPASGRASKRQKTPVPDASDSQDLVTVTGLKWVTLAKNAKDAKGNDASVEFLTLPSKAIYPEYYDQTLLPIAIDTIEQKILDNAYPDVSAIESDIRRMIQNAKEYNESGSEIFLSAERLRKLSHNFMKTHNPDYNRPDYVAQPTALPSAFAAPIAAPAGKMKIRLKTGKDNTPAPVATKEHLNAGKRHSLTVPTPGSAIAKTSVSTADRVAGEVVALSPDEEGYTPTFEGKTFQQAQEQILLEISKHREEGGEINIFEPFVTMPSRKLLEYYRVIRDPTSISKVLQKVRGFQERGKYSGISDFRSWDAYANEVSRIWQNARIFNEDGSDIYVLSEELEDHFKRRLADAKKHVEEPPQPTLKLNMPKATTASSLKIRLGSQKETQAQHKPPTPSEAPLGVSVDESALQRQKDAVQVAVGGQNRATLAKEPTGITPNDMAASPKPIAGIKAEPQFAHSSIVHEHQARPGSQQSASGSRAPNGSHYHALPGPSHGYVPPAPSGFDNKFRREGHDASSAILASVHLTAGPYSSQGKQPFSLLIPAHPTLTQQHVTLNLTYAQLPTAGIVVTPNISEAVAFNKSRPHRVFVTLSNINAPNGTRFAPIPSFRHTQLGIHGNDGMQRYEVKFAPGLNRVEIECVAVAEGALGAGTLANKGGLEMEKTTVFVNLLRTGST